MNKIDKRLREWKEKTHWTKSEHATLELITDVQEFWADYTYSLVLDRLQSVPRQDWHLFSHAIAEAVQSGIATAMDEYQGTL